MASNSTKAAATAAVEEEEEDTEEETEQETRRLAICWKITKRGKLRKIVREVYLRDDLSCGVAGCVLCSSTTNSTAAASAAALLAGSSSPSKRVDFLASEDVTGAGGETQAQKLLPQERILLPDATALLQHATFFEEEPFVSGCFILSSVLSQLRSKSLQTYATVCALCSSSSPPVPQQQQQAGEEAPREKRFFLFNNEFARATYVERRPDETHEEKDVRAVFTAAKWLQQHLRAAAAAAGLPAARAANVTLLTSDRHIKEKAQQLNLNALTVKEYAEEMRAVYPNAVEKLTFSVEETEPGEGGEEEEEEKKKKDEARKPPQDSSSSAAAASFSKKRTKKPLFAEHLREAAIAAGLRAGTLVKGKLRMLQDCCWRGIVIAGGEEIRIRGRANLNRAMEGDVVAVEVLQQQQQPQEEKQHQQQNSGQAAVSSGSGEAEEEKEKEEKEKSGGRAAPPETRKRQQKSEKTASRGGGLLPYAAAAGGDASAGTTAEADDGGEAAAAAEVGGDSAAEVDTKNFILKRKKKQRQAEKSEAEGGAAGSPRAAAMKSQRAATAAGDACRRSPRGESSEAAAATAAAAAATTAAATAATLPGDVLLEGEAEERAAEAVIVHEEAAVFPSADLSDSEIEKLEQLEMMEEEKEVDTQEKKATKEGKIVGIIRKGRREFCGTLRPFDNVYRADAAAARALAEVVFIPSDRRFPNVLIKTRRFEQLANKRLVVVVDGWDRFSRYPRGHWTEVLGDFGSAEAEAAVILREHGVISRDFSLASLRCLPPSNWRVEDLPREERSRRLDLRGICVCSIDPPGCKDIDDTLSLEVLPNGNYKVGVHIADVTYFLREGSALDEEAAERCTTVYLVERRTDMLPSLLTTDLCSLVADQDRLAFSVLWEMTPEGNILSSSMHRSIIHSRAALTYAEAQSIIDDLTDQTELAQNLRRLMAISKALRRRRMDQGALQLASPDVQIIRETITEDAAAAAGGAATADDSGHTQAAAAGGRGGEGGKGERECAAGGGGGRKRLGTSEAGRARDIIGVEDDRGKEREGGGGKEFHAEEVVQTEASDITLYQARDTNRMVEDLMLLANITVAEKVVNYFPCASLLRRHPPPREKQLKALQDLLKRAGVDDFNIASSKEISASLSRVAERSPELDFLVRVLTTRCMEQAVYFNTADAVQQQQQQLSPLSSAATDNAAAAASPSTEDAENSCYNAFFRHYGLAAPIYAHFTSPIRRYADVIIHRMLAAAIGIGPVPAVCSDKQKLSQQCELLNVKHRSAQLAGRSSVQYYVYRYFKSQGEKEAVGIITKVKRNGFLAYIHRYGLEGVVFVKEEDYSFDVKQQQLCSKRSAETLSVFDEVLLRVAASQDNFRPTVNMTLIRKKKSE